MILRSIVPPFIRPALSLGVLLWSVGGSALAAAETAEPHATASSAPAASAPAHPAPEAPTDVPAEDVQKLFSPRNTEELHAGPVEAAVSRQLARKAEKAARAREGEGLNNLGASLSERGDFPAAEIAYRQILDQPDYGDAAIRDALLGLARMYRKKGEFTKAAAIYEKFLKLYAEDPRVPDALLELGRTQRALGADRGAISRFYSVINSTLKVPSELFDHYQLLAKTAQFEIAETHFESGEYAEAGKFFSRLRLLDLAPADRARAHFKSAYSLVLAGELDQAVVTLHNYLDQWPQDDNVPEARSLLATTLRRLNRKQEALEVTLELLRNQHDRAPANPKSWAYWQRRTGNQLANDFFQSGDTLHAAAIYEGLAALSDEPAWRLPNLYQLALCYERLRQVDRAGATYQVVIDAVAGLKEAAPELTDLARMSQWRIGQLTWHDQTDRQLTSFFNTATVKPAEAAPASPPAQPKDDEPHGSTPATPPAL